MSLDWWWLFFFLGVTLLTSIFSNCIVGDDIDLLWQSELNTGSLDLSILDRNIFSLGDGFFLSHNCWWLHCDSRFSPGVFTELFVLFHPHLNTSTLSLILWWFYFCVSCVNHWKKESPLDCSLEVGDGPLLVFILLKVLLNYYWIFLIWLHLYLWWFLFFYNSYRLFWYTFFLSLVYA